MLFRAGSENAVQDRGEANLTLPADVVSAGQAHLRSRVASMRHGVHTVHFRGLPMK